MLAETETSLVEIALSVGFQTQAHFTTVFKRFVGVTPHRWRTRNHSEERDVRQGERDIRIDPARETRTPFHHRAA
jgi:AraC-like DNA-binding protein